MTGMRGTVGILLACHRVRHAQLHNGKMWTQEDLAVACGTDKGHISRIERGHQIPARATLHRICEALGLSWDERAEMMMAAGYAPGLLMPGDAELARIVEQAAAIVDRLPYPAVVCDILGRAWHYNPLVLRLYSSATGMSGDEFRRACRGRSAPEVYFDPVHGPRLRAVVSEATLRAFCARMRAMAAQWQHSPEWQERIDCLLRIPAFAAMWDDAPSAEEMPFSDRHEVELSHPQLGELRFETWATRLATDSRFFVSHHRPMDEVTKAAMVVLAAEL